MKIFFMSIVFTSCFFLAHGQEEADSTLTIEEIQFRDSIASINTKNALIQVIQESYNAGIESFALSKFK